MAWDGMGGMGGVGWFGPGGLVGFKTLERVRVRVGVERSGLGGGKGWNGLMIEWMKG